MATVAEKVSEVPVVREKSKRRWLGLRPARALSPFEEMDRMFDEFMGRGWMRPRLRTWFDLEEHVPRIDMIERDDEIVLRAEMPGVAKGDLDVTMTENMITLRGMARHAEEKGEYLYNEISGGEFARTLAVPAEVDGSKVQATYTDGIVEVVLPKVEISKRRKIKIN